MNNRPIANACLYTIHYAGLTEYVACVQSVSIPTLINVYTLCIGLTLLYKVSPSYQLTVQHTVLGYSKCLRVVVA